MTTDTDRINWLSQCTAGEWENLQNTRLAAHQGYLRTAIDNMMTAHPAKPELKGWVAYEEIGMLADTVIEMANYKTQHEGLAAAEAYLLPPLRQTNQCLAIGMRPLVKYPIKVLAAIRSCFTDANADRLLVNADWKSKRKESGIPSTGFCYLATFAYYELMGAKQDSAGGHYWIECTSGDCQLIIDLTENQYPKGFQYYGQGLPTDFRPNKRTKAFTNLVRKALG